MNLNEPIGWYEPTTKKFATSPTSFPMAAQIVPVYRHPATPAQPALPPWRGLTSAERKTLWNLTKKAGEYGEMIEAKLREKNERS